VYETTVAEINPDVRYTAVDTEEQQVANSQLPSSDT
jgi:hypothetical protein